MRYFVTIFILYSLTNYTFAEEKEITWDILNSGFSFNTWGIESKIDSIKINNKLYPIDRKIENNTIFHKYEIKSTDYIYQANRLKDSEMEIVVSYNDQDKKFLYSIQPDCKDILSIIGREIINRSYNNGEKIGEATQNMSEIFEILKKDRLENILSGIKSIKDASDISKSCLTTFHLLKFIDNDKYYGYGDRDFKPTENIKKSIIGVTELLKKYLEKFDKARSEAIITVTGYADSRNIDFKKGEIYNTTLARIGNGCSNNKMEKEQPILYNEKKQFSLIPKIVKNNCQLSALRAYKAVEFIKSNLKLDIKYFYISGGSLKPSTDNSKDRKIDISISVHASREE